MATINVLILSAIVSAFLLFGGVLAWGDFYSRGATRGLRTASDEEADAAKAETKIVEHRKAA